MKSKLFAVMFFWTSLVVANQALAQPSIELDPDTDTLDGAGSISVDINITGLTGTGPFVGGYDLDFEYDSSIFSGVMATPGASLGAPADSLFGTTDFSFSTFGILNLFEVSFVFDLEPLQGGLTEFTLATIDLFRADPSSGTGTTAFSTSIFSVSDDLGGSLSIASNPGAEITLTDGAASVPAPATALLLLGALFGMGLRSRRAR
ncbi:MAG: hypothetical protein AAF756_03990 [Pseudomonadota bacterium]